MDTLKKKTQADHKANRGPGGWKCPCCAPGPEARTEGGAAMSMYTSELRFELEELMGGGKWAPVWETKEQADYESPDHLSFETEGEATEYAAKNWRTPAYVRIVAVRTIRTIIEEDPAPEPTRGPPHRRRARVAGGAGQPPARTRPHRNRGDAIRPQGASRCGPRRHRQGPGRCVMPRFTFTEGTSSKFWEIDRDEYRITLKWGRIGANPTTRVKEYEGTGKARREYEKMIMAKLAEGYAPEGAQVLHDRVGGLRCCACGGACEELIAAPGSSFNSSIKRKAGVLELQRIYGAAAGVQSDVFCPTCSVQAEAMVGALVEAVRMAAADRKQETNNKEE